MVLYGLRMYENKLFLFEKARESVMSAFECCRTYCMKIKGFFGSIVSRWVRFKLKKGFIYLQLRCSLFSFPFAGTNPIKCLCYEDEIDLYLHSAFVC